MQNNGCIVWKNSIGCKREYAFIFLNKNINTLKIHIIFLWWNYGIYFGKL